MEEESFTQSLFEVVDMQAFCDRLREAAESREDVTLWGTDYIAMPVDADGEYIHVGDVMEWPYGNGEFIVEGIGGNTLFYIDKDSNECEWTAAGDKRHRHEPTVEDVLREACNAYHSLLIEGMSDVAHDMPAPSEIIAEYAAKLQVSEE